MSLQDKSAQTISLEVAAFEARILQNRSRIEMLKAMIVDMENENKELNEAIIERGMQLHLRAKQKR